MTKEDHTTSSPMEQYDQKVQEALAEALRLHNPAEFIDRERSKTKETELDPITIMVEGKSVKGVLWTSKERVVRHNEEGKLEVIDYTRQNNLIDYIVKNSGEDKKTRALAEGIPAAYKATRKQQTEALKDEIIVDSLVDLKPAEIRHEFDQKGSKAAEVVAEYYLAAARKLYGDEIPLDDVRDSLLKLIESTNPSEHAAMKEFIQAASRNCHKRFMHFQTNLKGLERRAKGLGIKLDSNEPGLTKEEARQMTLDQIKFTDQQVEAREDLK